MEIEKAHNLPFVSWRPRETGGIVLRTIEPIVDVIVQGQEKTGVLASGNSLQLGRSCFLKISCM